MPLDWATTELRSPPTPWQTRSLKSPRGGEKRFDRQRKKKGSKSSAFIGCWRNRKGSTSTIPMKSSGSRLRSTSKHSSTFVLTSEGRFWFTVLHIRGRSRRDGTSKNRGILPRRLSGYVLKRLKKEMFSTASSLWLIRRPTSSTR